MRSYFALLVVFSSRLVFKLKNIGIMYLIKKLQLRSLMRFYTQHMESKSIKNIPTL